MCGIFGFIGEDYSESGNDLERMRISLHHRGPDHYGYFLTKLESQISVNLGHVRLAIIDISETGNQPMKSNSERYTIVFNGEIYNFKDIRQEIETINPIVKWKGSSDTEVLLAGIELFGIQNCVAKLVGMFAFSVWDNQKQSLYLVRDRIGEKPLYYGFQGDQLIFASELKAFEVHSKFNKSLNVEAAVEFLDRSYVPNYQSIYTGVNKVKPGTILEFQVDSIKNQMAPEVHIYWSLEEIIKNKGEGSFKGGFEEAQFELEKLLLQSIRDVSISDVPLGAFLSGGIDSSIVCALLKKNFKSELNTFTIAMPAPGVNEALHAERVARQLQTNHKEKEISTDDIINRIEEIINHWDEPFADSSQIPTFLVSELARKEVTVVLSGDGADEFLYGYQDHQIYSKYKKLQFISYLGLDSFVLIFLKLIGLGATNITKKVETLQYLLGLFKKYKNIGEIHQHWHNKFWNCSLPVKRELVKSSKKSYLNSKLTFSNVGHFDALNYLPNDILVKVDRAAMAVSLETRAPFLDYRVLEFLISLPKEYLYKNGKSKIIAKEILYKYVSKEIIDRPKQGFSIPMSYWLKNNLKTWAQKIIQDIPNQSEFWDKKIIEKIWSEHQSGYRDHPEKIWNILVLENFFKSKQLLHYSATDN